MLVVVVVCGMVIPSGSETEAWGHKSGERKQENEVLCIHVCWFKREETIITVTIIVTTA